jgi:predicted nucleic acid-binding protein
MWTCARRRATTEETRSSRATVSAAGPASCGSAAQRCGLALGAVSSGKGETLLIWVLLAIIVALLCVVGALVVRQRRSAQLREGFGPEYDRVVQERGDQREAEAELRERRDRRRRYDIRPLEDSARERYAERWEETQRRFVDQPASAVAEADGLIGEVMRDRGYPVEDFDQQAADLSVDHPEVVEHYRSAHAVSLASGDQNASTEDLRTAMVHYRALFSELLDHARTEVKETK